MKKNNKPFSLCVMSNIDCVVVSCWEYDELMGYSEIPLRSDKAVIERDIAIEIKSWCHDSDIEFVPDMLSHEGIFAHYDKSKLILD